MSGDIDKLLTESAAIDCAAIDPAVRLDLAGIPAKGAVYLLLDEAGTPMLLATVRNLRAALERRLTDTPTEQKSSRLQYGQLCSRLRYRVVHSPFAANFYYLQTARVLFPKQYQAMVSWRAAWFVGVDLEAEFPQFRKTTALGDAGLTCFGPIPDKHAAGRAVELLDDLFDLCRYHNILVQAPHGKACAYKEMGKCPAPCDGTIAMAAYHGQIRAAAAVLGRGGYEAWRMQQEGQMKVAAAGLNFEAAGKIKTRLGRGAVLEQYHFRQMDGLANFRFLALQPGPGTSWVQPIFVHGGEIEEGEAVNRKGLAGAVEKWFKKLAGMGEVRMPVSREAAERVALVSFHLFRGEDDAGIYLRRGEVGSAEEILMAAEGLLDRRRPAKPLPDQGSDRQQEAEVVLPLDSDAADLGK